MAADHPISKPTDRLPYGVYVTLAVLVLWLALAAWGFAGAGYVDLTLTVVSGFLLMVLAIPFVLWRVWRLNRDPKAEPDVRQTFADWTNGTFETWQDRVKGTNAVMEILLPIGAAAVGMTAFAIVFHYAALHASV